jgi:hypothetical protein
VTKGEIIQMTIQAMGLDSSSLTPENEEYRAVVEATLMERLPPGTNFKTCKDFEHLAIGCCVSIATAFMNTMRWNWRICLQGKKHGFAAVCTPLFLSPLRIQTTCWRRRWIWNKCWDPH